MALLKSVTYRSLLEAKYIGSVFPARDSGVPRVGSALQHRPVQLQLCCRDAGMVTEKGTEGGRRGEEEADHCGLRERRLAGPPLRAAAEHMFLQRSGPLIIYGL